MKKLLLSAIMLMSIIGYSQSDSRFGLKAGLNLANFKGDVSNTENALSYHAGILFEAPIGNHLSFQPEFLYSVKGAKSSKASTSIGGLSTSGETKYKLNYLSIPLALKLYLSDNISIEAGPQFGYLLSAEREVTATSETGSSSTSSSGVVDVKDNYNSIDYGLVAGLGMRLNNGMVIGGRYNLGMANILKDNDVITVNNSAIQLYVGFLF